MKRFKEKLYRFMYGRYGNDALSHFCMLLALALVLADVILGLFLEGIAGAVVSLSLGGLVIALYVWILFRCFSRNVYKRRRENEVYLSASRTVKRALSGNTSKRTKSRNYDDAFYIFRDCTKCASTLRLPKKTGKNSVKCPKCGHLFYVKSK
jgi:DNA-directed RNA polymerase subunit RPC12/RpoP